MQLNDFRNKPDMKKSAELVLVGPTFEKSKKFARDDKRAKSIADVIMKMMVPVLVYMAEWPLLFGAKGDAITKCFHMLTDSNVKKKSFL